MRYSIVLNGCSNNYIKQAEEINEFIKMNCLKEEQGNAIIFYCENSNKEQIIQNCPLEKIKLIKVNKYQPENYLKIINQIEADNNIDLYIFSSDLAGNELSVRVAFRLGGSSLVAVNQISKENEKLIFCKMVYSNQMLGKFELNKKPYCISIAKGFAAPLHVGEEKDKEILEIDMTNINEDSFIIEYSFNEDEITEGLEKSKFILAVGRGARNINNIEKLKEIAIELGADIGVSRPVAMSAWMPMNKLIGVSGVMTKPEICIAVGVSGAAAFYTGIEKSKFIIAINTDEKASIIKDVDIAIIDEYERILEELVKITNQHRVDKSL